MQRNGLETIRLVELVEMVESVCEGHYNPLEQRYVFIRVLLRTDEPNGTHRNDESELFFLYLFSSVETQTDDTRDSVTNGQFRIRVLLRLTEGIEPTPVHHQETFLSRGLYCFGSPQ